MTPRSLQLRWERAARAFEGTDTPWLADYSTRRPQQWAVRREEMFPAVCVPFEDITVRLPRDYDTVLTRGFGNYMELPPEGERHNHQPYHVDFGPFGDKRH